MLMVFGGLWTADDLKQFSALTVLADQYSPLIPGTFVDGKFTWEKKHW
jgi:hypothetical protein